MPARVSRSPRNSLAGQHRNITTRSSPFSGWLLQPFRGDLDNHDRNPFATTTSSASASGRKMGASVYCALLACSQNGARRDGNSLRPPRRGRTWALKALEIFCGLASFTSDLCPNLERSVDHLRSPKADIFVWPQQCPLPGRLGRSSKSETRSLLVIRLANTPHI